MGGSPLLVSKVTWTAAALLAALNLVLPTVKGIQLIHQARSGMSEGRVLDIMRFDSALRVRLSQTVPDDCILRSVRGFAILPGGETRTVPVEASGPGGWSFDLTTVPTAASVALETRRACQGSLPRPHLLGPWNIERTPPDDRTS